MNKKFVNDIIIFAIRNKHRLKKVLKSVEISNVTILMHVIYDIHT